jgi:hypothetical protein
MLPQVRVRTYSIDFLAKLPLILPLEIWLIIFQIKYNLENYMYFHAGVWNDVTLVKTNSISLRNGTRYANHHKGNHIYTKFLQDSYHILNSYTRTLCHHKKNHTPFLKRIFYYILEWFPVVLDNDLIDISYDLHSIKYSVIDIVNNISFDSPWCCEAHKKEAIYYLANARWYINNFMVCECNMTDTICFECDNFIQYIYNQSTYIENHTKLRNDGFIRKSSYISPPIIIHDLIEVVY